MDDFTENRKYIALLEKSKELFWKFGYRRVTIEEICREANTSKMTFYRFFPNKLELAKAVLAKFFSESLENFRKVIREESPAPVKMQKLIQLKLKGTNDISDEFIQDFYSKSNSELNSFVEGKSRLIREEGIKDFKRGQKEGWIRKDLNVEFLFGFSQKITPLVNDKELLKLYGSNQDLIMELANLIVYGITPRE